VLKINLFLPKEQVKSNRPEVLVLSVSKFTSKTCSTTDEKRRLPSKRVPKRKWVLYPPTFAKQTRSSKPLTVYVGFLESSLEGLRTRCFRKKLAAAADRE
jgi:hypothetical protein